MIEMTLYPSGDLFPTGEYLPNVQKGVVELGVVWSDPQMVHDVRFGCIDDAAGSPLDTVSDLAILAYNTDYLDVIGDLYAEWNVKLLGVGFNPPEQVLTTVPIKSLADFKGLKLRGSGPSELLYRAMGGSPTVVDFSEVYTALQLGTVVGGDIAGPKVNWENGFHEVTKYIIEPFTQTSGSIIHYTMNMDTWNQLTPDLQSILTVSAEASGYQYWTDIRGDDYIYRQKMLDYGLELCTIPESEMIKIRALILGVWDELAARDPCGAHFIELNKEVAALVGKPME
jgi:TRAP-type C4-dicarboxylate transport system substrate-binding protein